MTGAPGVRLRAHHLICLQFFRGEGYDAAFVTNLDTVLESLASGAATIVRGPDDVCAACPNLDGDTCVDPNSGGEQEIRRIDTIAKTLLGVTDGETCSLAYAARRLREPGVAERWRTACCDGCAWESVCEPGWERLLGR